MEGWRILRGQISDFMQKKISDVERRISNTSAAIVVFRATRCSTKKSFSLSERNHKNLLVFRPSSSRRLSSPNARLHAD